VDDYRAVNRANWDERVPVHVASREYGIERFVENPVFLVTLSVRSTAPRRHLGQRGVHINAASAQT
jgi:hypothetical protein